MDFLAPHGTPWHVPCTLIALLRTRWYPVALYGTPWIGLCTQMGVHGPSNGTGCGAPWPSLTPVAL